jgi:diacylglycerol kinase family enzyme
MNAEYLGRWDVAPRAHPGDGLLDVLDARIGFGERLEARRRLPTGTHVPHPRITERRVQATQLDLERPTTIFLDGAAVGRARTLSIRVEADALRCVI